MTTLETILPENATPTECLTVMRRRAFAVLRESEQWLIDVASYEENRKCRVSTPSDVFQMRNVVASTRRYIDAIDAKLAELRKEPKP